MTQFEYTTATSGVYHCACMPCFDVVYGNEGEMCHSCEEAGCALWGDSCQRDDALEEC